MDIVYDSQRGDVLAFFDTSGEVDTTGKGSIPFRVAMQTLERKNNYTKAAAVWSWITKDQATKIPSGFFKTPEQYRVYFDANASPCGLIDTKTNTKYELCKRVLSRSNVPVIWNGIFFDTISYSLINRRFVFGLQDRGFDVKASAMKTSKTDEISKQDYERLESLGVNSVHLHDQDAIKVYCYIPINRTPPVAHGISYTMMESQTVSPRLASTLNSYYDECWFPCFVEQTSVCAKDDFTWICNAQKGSEVQSHTGKFNPIVKTMKRKYSGQLCHIDTVLFDDQLVCTPEHPFVTIRFNDKKEPKEKIVKAKDLKPTQWLFYPRDIRESDISTLSVSEFLTKRLAPNTYSVRCIDNEVTIRYTKQTWNHMTEKLAPYTYTLEGKLPDTIILDDDFFSMLGMLNFKANIRSGKGRENQKRYSCFGQKHANELARCFKKFFKVDVEVNKETYFYGGSTRCYCDYNLYHQKNEVLDLLISRLQYASDTLIPLFNRQRKAAYLRGFFGTTKTNMGGKNGLSHKFEDFEQVKLAVKFLMDLGFFPISKKSQQGDERVLIINPEKYRALSYLIGKSDKYESPLVKGKGWKITPERVLYQVKNTSFEDVENVDVYNLEVRTDNTYVANLISVHNCNDNIRSFLEAGVVKPVHHMPLAIDHEKYKVGIEPCDKVNFEVMNPCKSRFGEKPSGFRFLSVFRYTYRKGPDVLIKAFRKAFRATDDVSLVLHCRHYLGNIESSKIDTVQAVRAEIKKWMQDDKGAAPVYWSHDCLSDDDMPHLYGWGDCFVTTSRGEGFGLTPLEAAGCGLPVIAPNHSGFGDYISDDNAYVIHLDGLENCGHIEVKSGVPVYVGDNAEWTTWITNAYRDQMFPILGDRAVDEAAEHMRYVYENYSKALKKADMFRKHVLANYTWDIAIDKVAKRLNELKE